MVQLDQALTPYTLTSLGTYKENRERADHSVTSDPNLNMNITTYRYNHKHRDATEKNKKLHFINRKILNYAYKQNGNKIARAMVAYL